MEERFDLNQVQISGCIQKIWDYDQDIFLRLRFQPEAERPDRFVTLRIPDGMIAGQMISLQPGEMAQVDGHLVDMPYIEDIRQFFKDAKASHVLESIEKKSDWLDVQVKRIGTQTDVGMMATVNNDPQLNKVLVQGIAVRVWKGGADLFVRLAIYDEHTTIIEQRDGKLPKRKPHYVTLRFPGGKAGDKKIHIAKRQRLRASGYVHVRHYKQSLEDVLKRAGKEELRKTLPPHQTEEISALRDSIYVVVESIVLFANKG